MRKARGWTLLEALTVMAIGTIILTASASGILARVRHADLMATIEQAKKVAEVAEIYRLTVRTATTGANGEYIYTYAEYPSGITAANFNAANGTDLPELSPFGTPYTVFSNDFTTCVKVNVPFSVTPANVGSVAVGPNLTRLTITADLEPNRGRADVGFVRWTKRHFYLEEAR